MLNGKVMIVHLMVGLIKKFSMIVILSNKNESMFS